MSYLENTFFNFQYLPAHTKIIFLFVSVQVSIESVNQGSKPKPPLATQIGFPPPPNPPKKKAKRGTSFLHWIYNVWGLI